MSLIITNEQVKKHMTLDRAIACVEDTWRWYGEGRIVMPNKITTDMSALGVNGWFNSMPSYIGPMDSAGIKVVGGYSDNPKRGLPYIRANVLLTDPHDGTLRALLCGDYISDARTGAQPAVAMKYLAASTKVVTVIGAGMQAYYSVSCIARTHRLDELRVCDVRPEARERFCGYFPDADFAVKPYDSIENACVGADVIITLTTADEPLVSQAWCKKGCLVLTMGSFTEIADDVIEAFDRVCIDHAGQGLHRGSYKTFADRGLITHDSIDAELPMVVAGKRTGRSNPDERIVCELVGMGAPDVVIATCVYNEILASSEHALAVDMLV